MLKLNLEKAYDKVNCTFLNEILKLKGFGKRWRRWIWGYLSSINFSVIINGRPRGKIMGHGGLRQRHAVSPVLLTIVGDAFSNIVHCCNKRRLIHGFSFGNPSVEVMHLQYVDDISIFCSWGD